MVRVEERRQLAGKGDEEGALEHRNVKVIETGRLQKGGPAARLAGCQLGQCCCSGGGSGLLTCSLPGRE